MIGFDAGMTGKAEGAERELAVAQLRLFTEAELTPAILQENRDLTLYSLLPAIPY